MTSSPVFLLICLLVSGASLAQPAPAHEAASDDGKFLFKFTPTHLSSSDGNDALDLNLRGAIGAHTAWLGYYRNKEGFSQARGGYEYREDFGLARTVLSLQLASGGFAGGSATAELGLETYAIAGWGRTNLRNYYNLNFDPNDAITLGVGTRAIAHTELSIYQIRDDRLGTGQRITHAVARYKATASERWTVDMTRKSGMTDTGAQVQGYGLSVTYDFGNYFARLTRDPYANFSDASQTRISLGLRF